MPYDEAHKRATLKYQKENLVCLAIRMKPEEKDRIAAGAAAAGKSIKNYLLDLVDAEKK